MQTTIYVMRHIDIGGHIEFIPYKKVGITGAGNATWSSRLQQISDTKSPIKAQCIAAWKHEDARAVENALHTLMEDSRVEGEWFLDKEDTLVERMRPIMKLIGAEEIAIEQSDDAYTQTFKKKENKTKQQSDHILLGEISNLLAKLDKPLRSSSTVNGPTFWSDEKSLTYYVYARTTGLHHLFLGRSKNIYEDIKEFLESHNFDVEQHETGEAKVIAISAETVANVINLIEREFEPK